MSWSTNLMCWIPFNRRTYNSKSKVESDYEYSNKLIETIKKNIAALVTTTEPQKYFPESENPVQEMLNELDGDIECLVEALDENIRLGFLLDNWDKCHTADGDAIPIPNEIKYDSAFIDGDFIRTADKKVEE